MMDNRVVQYQVQKCGVDSLSRFRTYSISSNGSIMLVEIKSVANFHINSRILKHPNLKTTILLRWRLLPTPLNRSVPSDINLGLFDLDHLSMEKLRRWFGREKMGAPWGHLAGWCVGVIATRDGCWPWPATRPPWSFDGICDFASFPPRVTSAFSNPTSPRN